MSLSSWIVKVNNNCYKLYTALDFTRSSVSAFNASWSGVSLLPLQQEPVKIPTTEGIITPPGGSSV